MRTASLLRSQSLSGTVLGAVGTSLGLMRGMTDESQVRRRGRGGERGAQDIEDIEGCGGRGRGVHRPRRSQSSPNGRLGAW